MPLDTLKLPGVLGPDLGKELLLALDLAKAAGHEVVKFRTSGKLGIEMKPGDEPVTAADRAASEIIVQGIRGVFPNDAVISEEMEVDPDAMSAPRCWLVDPIDGTKDFIRGGDGFAVMIGLVRDGKPVLGVVHQPTIERTFFVSPGTGAFVAHAGSVTSLSVSIVGSATEARLVASASHRTPDIDRVKTELGIVDELNVGSVGIKLCLIAAGQRDLYVNPAARTKAWDTCAPEAILLASGGRLSDLFGDPIDYRGELAHRRGLVASNRWIHDEVIAKVGPLFAHYR
ncbi:MAG: 3'(2'),5'-bisphosphate nucleotidase CysQ [Deltaproteobacteria bacterium]|nr:3'(2'),5'-bisphosphate nucleotidase CysQ [Deltaproteobacteria bacterium]